MLSPGKLYSHSVVPSAALTPETVPLGRGTIAMPFDIEVPWKSRERALGSASSPQGSHVCRPKLVTGGFVKCVDSSTARDGEYRTLVEGGGCAKEVRNLEFPQNLARVPIECRHRTLEVMSPNPPITRADIDGLFGSNDTASYLPDIEFGLPSYRRVGCHVRSPCPGILVSSTKRRPARWGWWITVDIYPFFCTVLLTSLVSP